MIPHDEIAYLIRASAGICPEVPIKSTINFEWRGYYDKVLSHFMYMFDYALGTFEPDNHTVYLRDALRDMRRRLNAENLYGKFFEYCRNRKFSRSFGTEYLFSQQSHFIIEVETYIRENNDYPWAFHLRNRAGAILQAILESGADWCIFDSHGDCKVYTTAAEGPDGFSVRAIEAEKTTGTSKTTSHTLGFNFNMAKSGGLDIGASSTWSTSSTTSIKAIKGPWKQIKDSAELGIKVYPTLSLQTMLIRISRVASWMAPIKPSSKSCAYTTTADYERHINISVMPTLLDYYAATDDFALAGGGAAYGGLSCLPYGRNITEISGHLHAASESTFSTKLSINSHQDGLISDMQKNIMAMKCGALFDC